MSILRVLWCVMPIALCMVLTAHSRGRDGKATMQMGGEDTPIGVAASLRDTVRSPAFRTAMEYFYQNNMKESLLFFNEALVEGKVSVDIIMAWMAKAMFYHARENDSAYSISTVERSARMALISNENSSLANEVLADVLSWKMQSQPEESTPSTRDSILSHLLHAVEVDSNNASAWKSIWTHSVQSNRRTLEQRALARLWDMGYFTPSVLAMNRWQLQHLPPNAILLTNGDNDTYPAHALQHIQGLRKDVAIVNLSLLNLADYAKNVSRYYDFPLGFSEEEVQRLQYEYGNEKKEWIRSISDQIVERWIDMYHSGKSKRPIAIAATCGEVGRDVLQNSQYAQQFVALGPYSCIGCTFNERVLTRWIDSLNVRDFTSANYNPNTEHSPIIRNVPPYSALINVLTGIVSVASNDADNLAHWCSKALAFERRVGVQTDMHTPLQQCVDAAKPSQKKQKPLGKKKKS